MSTEVQRGRWSRPLAGIALVAVIGAGLGAFFGIRAIQRAGSASSAGQPPARTGAAMAYDAANGSVILFGGQSKTRSLDDTWTWDGSGWTQAHPATSPPPLDNAQMTYDPMTHDMLLVGVRHFAGLIPGPIACSSGSGSSSSGSSSGSATLIVPPVNPLPAIAPAPGATANTGRTPTLSPACSTVVSPSAVTWLWNGGDWSKASASTPFVFYGSGALATDPVSNRVVLLARGPFPEPMLGAAQPAIACPVQRGAPATQPSCPFPFHVTPGWTWNGHTWKAMASGVSTSSFGWFGSSIVDDAVTGKLASFGGEFIAPTPAPLPCQGCGSRAPVKQSTCCTGTESVWTGTAWKQIATYRNGPATPGVAFVGDPATHSDVVLTGDGQTWRWNGAWTRLHPGTTPLIMSGVASAYDATTGQVVMFGGYGAAAHETGLYDQTWTWDGSDWTQRGGSAGPSVTIPVPSPVSIPPGLPCTPVPSPSVEPQTVCNGKAGGGSGSTGGSAGATTSSGVVAP
jgi:hypothetical protein